MIVIDKNGYKKITYDKRKMEKYNKQEKEKQDKTSSFYNKRGNCNQINTAHYIPARLVDKKHKQVWEYHKAIILK